MVRFRAHRRLRADDAGMSEQLRGMAFRARRRVSQFNTIYSRPRAAAWDADPTLSFGCLLRPLRELDNQVVQVRPLASL